MEKLKKTAIVINKEGVTNMKLKKLIKSGIKNLAVNKMRTSLAILGIVIGIGSVIALVSMGEASKKAVQSQIQSIGSNLLTISPGFTSSGGVRGAFGGATTLTNEDAKAIKTSSQITTIKNVSPEYSSRALPRRSQPSGARRCPSASMTPNGAKRFCWRRATSPSTARAAPTPSCAY